MITVFTPTYNRAKQIVTLYESLEAQTEKSFEWVVVDDGSDDDTEHVLSEIKKKATFSVVYKKKQNEGKHIAINEGSRLANGEWFFVVDSDDYLTPEAIERITTYCKQIEDNHNYAGVVGLRGDKNGEILIDYYRRKRLNEQKKKNEKGSVVFGQEHIDTTALEYRYKYKIKGDRAEVVRTSIIREHPFPKFNNEKFLVEGYLWMTLAKEEYRFRWFNEVVYICEYLADGLTRNIEKHYANSPMGSCEVSNLMLSCRGVPMKEKIKSCYRYYKYGHLAGLRTTELLQGCNNRLLSLVGIPLSILRP